MSGKKQSKFAKDSAEASNAESAAQTSAMIQLFSPAPETGKLVRRNAPMMIKPDTVPLGSAVTGVIVRILDSPVSTIKGKLLWLRHESGTEFTFPCTGVIRNALCPGVKGDDELSKALEKEVGKTFVAIRQASKPSKYKKEMFMFDVFTTEK